MVNQLPIVRPPSFTPTQISYNRTQPSLHSKAINQSFRWPRYVQPHLLFSLTWMKASSSLWSVWKKFLYLFIFRLVFKVCLCQAIALHPMLHYVHFMFPLHCRNQLNRLFLPLLVAHWVSDLKISGAMTFRPFTERFLNGPLRRVLRRMPSGIFYYRLKHNYI